MPARPPTRRRRLDRSHTHANMIIYDIIYREHVCSACVRGARHPAGVMAADDERRGVHAPHDITHAVNQGGGGGGRDRCVGTTSAHASTRR
eukprot:COSAG01_NODE_3593_length_5898_cov_5.089310_4_plen_91_part_00